MFEPPMKRVSADVLRKMFNDGGYWEQSKDGRLQILLRSNKHPSSSRANEPICTRSQYIIYVNSEGQKIAGAHQYLRPDGNLGASGRPDPKELLMDGILYVLDTTETQPKHTVPDTSS